MAIDPVYLHRRVEDWPLVLCGPIVRRVTRTSAAVFVAAREAFSGTLEVYDGPAPGSLRLPDDGFTKASLPLGGQLHVLVLESVGLELEPGRIYGYDVQLDFVTSGRHDLGTLGLLGPPFPLGYVEGELPAFVLPGPLDRLKLVHGSCRKPHGCDHASLADPDVLPLVDRLIEDNRTDPYARVQQLILAGDQVYSDDVPAALLAALTAVGRVLLGWDRPERLPDRRDEEVFTDDHVRLDPGDRSAFLDDQGAKDRPADVDPAAWSDYAANHLLFFSEWCAMYLFAWSPELWQLRDRVDPTDRQLRPTLSYHYLAAATDAWGESPDTTTPSLIYAQGLHHVRRALANVATYMIFDDHDVTDDWFLDEKVDAQLRGRGETPNGVGRRLMRNALAAYAVFQHWGNAPEHFGPDTPGAALLALLDASDGTPPLGREGEEDAADVVLDVGPVPVGPARRDERMRWDFELVFDEHRLLVLDTRTWRSYPSAARTAPIDELLAAAGERAEELGDWGSAALAAMGSGWSDLADRMAGQVEPFLRAGGSLMSSTALLADHVADGLPAAAATAAAVIEAARQLLDALASSASIAGVQGLTDGIAAARDASIRAGATVAAAEEAASVAMATSAAFGEMTFRLETATAAWLVDVGVLGVTGSAVLAHATLVETAELCRAIAAYLHGSAVSHSRAARFAAVVVRTMMTLGSTRAAALFSGVTDDVAGELAALAVASTEFVADAEDLAERHAAIVDPVWTVLVGDGAKKVNAELLSPEALGFQVAERVMVEDHRRELTFVVSPGPVIGHWLAEFAQRYKVLSTELTAGAGDETWDNEPWAGNVAAFTRFLDATAELGSVVFLSGDVHYAFSSVSDYVSRSGAAARFVQFTSSATKNADGTTRSFGLLEETTDDLGEIAVAQFDFYELLPTEAEWAALPAALAATVPSREQAVAAVERFQAAAAEEVGDLVDAGHAWWNSSWDLAAVKEQLTRQADDAWDRTTLRWSQTKESVSKAVAEWRDDPRKALVGDSLKSLPLAQEQVLLLLSSLGIDPAEFPEIHTTVLRDRRADERIADSPGLAARLADRFNLTRSATLRLDRKTVGHANIGLVTTQRTPLGRFVTHDLMWFPFDNSALGIEPDPGLGQSWRDDWIVTRHVAGLAPPTPADGGAVGAPAPGHVVIGDLDIDVRSPTQSQRGAVRIHQIDPAGPTMPALEVSVRTPGLSGADDRALSRRVRLEVRYVQPGNRDDVTHVPGPTAQSFVTLPAGTTVWTPQFAEPCGGDVAVFAEVTAGPSTVTGSTPAGAHVIYGLNPSKDDVRGQAPSRTNVHVVWHRESRTNQFAASPTDIGRPVVGPQTVLAAADFGYGIGQLTREPFPTSRQLWDWRANVADSLARLEGARADAVAYNAQVREGRPWDGATGGTPPNEGTAFPEAPDFTTDELDKEMWARYNSGYRCHDYDPATGAWIVRPAMPAAVRAYVDESLALRNQVDAGTLPRNWS